MYLIGTYLICRKSQNQNIFYGFFCVRANAGQALAGKHRQHDCGQAQANKMQAGRRTGCQQRQHTSARIFSYTEN